VFRHFQTCHAAFKRSPVKEGLAAVLSGVHS